MVIGRSRSGQVYFLEQNINKKEVGHPDYHWVSKNFFELDKVVIAHRDKHNGDLPHTYVTRPQDIRSSSKSSTVERVNPFTGEMINEGEKPNTTLKNTIGIPTENNELYHGVWYTVEGDEVKYSCVKVNDYSIKPFGGVKTDTEYDFIELEISFLQLGKLSLYDKGKCIEIDYDVALNYIMEWAIEDIKNEKDQLGCNNLNQKSKNCIFGESFIKDKKNCNGGVGYSYGYTSSKDIVNKCEGKVFGGCGNKDQKCIFETGKNKFICRDINNMDNEERKVEDEEKNSYTMYILIGVGAVFLLAIGLYFFFRYRNKQKEKNNLPHNNLELNNDLYSDTYLDENGNQLRITSMSDVQARKLGITNQRRSDMQGYPEREGPQGPWGPNERSIPPPSLIPEQPRIDINPVETAPRARFNQDNPTDPFDEINLNAMVNQRPYDGFVPERPPPQQPQPQQQQPQQPRRNYSQQATRHLYGLMDSRTPNTGDNMAVMRPHRNLQSLEQD